MANWYKKKNDALQAEVAALKETIEKKDEYIRQIFSNQTAEGLNRLNKKLNTANLVIFQLEKDIKEKYVPKPEGDNLPFGDSPLKIVVDGESDVEVE
jgi:predicted RNase H-like nuclease (RuvC/YqgF family)